MKDKINISLESGIHNALKRKSELTGVSKSDIISLLISDNIIGTSIPREVEEIIESTEEVDNRNIYDIMRYDTGTPINQLTIRNRLPEREIELQMKVGKTKEEAIKLTNELWNKSFIDGLTCVKGMGFHQYENILKNNGNTNYNELTEKIWRELF